MRCALLLLAVLSLANAFGCSTRTGLAQLDVDARVASAGYVERDFADMHPQYP
jgi:hypothetical protein